MEFVLLDTIQKPSIFLLVSQVQFGSAGVLGARAIVVGCDFPLWMQYALVVYMASFMFLFGQFYVQAYRRKVRSQGRESKKEIKERSDQNRIRGVVIVRRRGRKFRLLYFIKYRELRIPFTVLCFDAFSIYIKNLSFSADDCLHWFTGEETQGWQKW